MKKFETTDGFINNHVRSGGFPAGEIIGTQGYYAAGDEGGARWKATGNTIAVSQTVIDTNDIKISDASGNEFEFVDQGIIDLNQLGGTSAAYVTIANNAGLTYSQSFTSIESNAKLTYATTAAMAASSLDSGDVGRVCETDEFSTGNGGGATYEVVLTSSVTPNGANIIQGTADTSISFVLRIGSEVDIRSFGLVPDGSTDNSSKLLLLLQNTAGVRVTGTGEYALASTTAFTQTGAINWDFQNLTFKATADIYGTDSYMIVITAADFPIDISGMELDGDSRTPQGFRINQSNASIANSVKFTKCKAKNFRRTLATHGTGACIPYRIKGSFSKVDFNDGEIDSVTRGAGAGIPLSAGCQGVVIDNDSTARPKYVNFSGNTVSDIDTDDPNGAANFDCDGVSIFDGSAVAASGILSTHVRVANNKFINCKGRAVKAQSATAEVTNNTVVRDAVLAINGGFNDINCQANGGNITGNNFFYYEVGGQSPFTETGGTTSESSAITIGLNDSLDAPVNISITGNTVYNNVAQGTGTLRSIISLARATSSLTKDGVANIANNNMSGAGQCEFFADTPAYNAQPNELVISLANCTVNKASLCFLQVNAFSANSVNIRAVNCGQLDLSNKVPFLWYKSSSTVPISSYSTMNDIGLVEGRVTGTSFNENSTYTGINALGPLPENIKGDRTGVFQVQTVTLADDATHTFESRGVNQFTCNFISTNAGPTSCGVFSINNTSSIDLGGGASTDIAYAALGTPTVNPDTDTKLNVYYNNTSKAVEIKNRLGATRVITLFTFG